MVGRTFIKVLEERNLPIDNIYFFSSSRSAGSTVTFNNKEYVVEELTETSFDRGIDIALFSAGASVSEKFAPIAASKGCVVVGQQQLLENERKSSPCSTGSQSPGHFLSPGHHSQSKLLHHTGGCCAKALT